MTRALLMTLLAPSVIFSPFLLSTALADDCLEYGHDHADHGNSHHVCGRDEGGNAYGHCAVGDAQLFADDTVDWQRGIVYFNFRANFGTAGGPASGVMAYNLAGELLDIVYLEDENTSLEHATVGTALDRDGNLMILSTQLGIVRLMVVEDENGDFTWVQSPITSGQFPAFIPLLPPPLPSSIPNGIVTDPETGDFYVTDSFQGSLWRVSENLSQMALVLPDPGVNLTLLGLGSGARMGANSLRFGPDHDLYFAFTGGFGVNGKIFRVPDWALNLEGDPYEIYDYLETVYTFDNPEALPDGLGFNEHGDHLYVTMAGTDSITVLDRNATGQLSFDSEITALYNVDIGMVSPSNLQLDPGSRWSIVVNHPIDEQVPEGGWTESDNPNRANWVYLDEQGDQLP